MNTISHRFYSSGVSDGAMSGTLQRWWTAPKCEDSILPFHLPYLTLDFLMSPPPITQAS